MRRLSALFLVAASALAQAPSRELFGQIDAISRELETISGLRLKRSVPSDFISKEKIAQFLRDRIKEVAKPEEIRAEELTLKKFGLVPDDFDLAKNTVDLLTEQAAAFYDYNRKKLFIAETTSIDSQTPVLVHELAHALADQSFNLARYIKKGRDNDDGAAARLAVMEGQASWLMAEYLARRSGQSLEKSPALVSMMSRMAESSGQFPVFEKAPLYMRVTLVFPYTKGMLFQHAMVEKHGRQAFSEVFAHPPVSTQQILHPEKYVERVRPTHPALPDPGKLAGFKHLVGGAMGELDHAVLIEQFNGAAMAAELAPNWRGSQFEIRENRKTRQSALLYSSEWSDEAAARRFFRAYRQALEKKWKLFRPEADDATSVSGAGDDGRFVLRQSGNLVTSMEGLPPTIH